MTKNKVIVMMALLTSTACGTVPAASVNVAGSAGDVGATGAQGAQGTPGTPGTGLTIQSGIYCTRIDNFLANNPLFYQYQSVIYSSGDRFVTCSVNNVAVQYSNSILYKSTQSGATTGSCKLVYDLNADSGGTWNFSSSGGVSQVQYLDNNSQYSGHTVQFSNSDCTTF